jgi:hypothetical protein
MAKGPCMCGDPACPSCGNPGYAEAVAAEEWALEQIAEAKLSPDEIRLALRVGIEAVKAHRDTVKAVVDQMEADRRMVEPDPW